MGRFIIWVLDGFGVGAMEDAAAYRAVDVTANTCLHVLEANPDLRLPQLERLGLINILGQEINGMRPGPNAIWGKAKLMHYGADTFYGHQEIAGTNPKRGELQLFSEAYEPVAEALQQAGFQVKEYILENGARLMGISDCAIISDNPANDPGQTFSMVGLSDVLPETEIRRMAGIIRRHCYVARLILHICDGLTYEEMEAAIHPVSEGRSGVDVVKLNVYDKNLRIVHMGYGVDETKQAPYLLGKHGVEVSHIGKFADIVANPYGTRNISCVDTAETINHLLQTVKEQPSGLICVNVQETDLAGHRQSPSKYGAVLKLVDDGIARLLPLLNPGDRLVIMADHGNDPTNQSTLHSREYVPLMVWGEGIQPGTIGIRETMSDVGAAAFEYFRRDPQYREVLQGVELGNGRSFL